MIQIGLIVGCFENYLLAKTIEVSGSTAKIESRFVQQGHSLNMYDQLGVRIFRDQQFELTQYLAYSLVQ